MTIPEPPDGARIEWEHQTDLYAAWCDTASSVAAGWRPDESWVLYPNSTPVTWKHLCDTFGDSLLTMQVLNANDHTAEITMLRQLVTDLHDSDPCSYDHNDNCQTHNLHRRPCPHERAKTLLNPQASP